MHLIGVHLIGMHLMGVHLLQGGIVDNFSNDLCAKLPRTRIRLSPEVALEIAPPIHSAIISQTRADLSEQSESEFVRNIDLSRNLYKAH